MPSPRSRARSSRGRSARTRRTPSARRAAGDFRTIQGAVNAADAGDTIKVRRGVYREAVRINGRKKRYLKLIGNPSRPGRVVLDGGGSKQNGIAVNAADEVTVSGFRAQRYRANGFFFTNLNGYTMNHLIAQQTGVYGLYAFNAIGIVPSALDSEKSPPPEKNVIVDNEIFWNNLNFHEGDPPFRPQGREEVPVRGGRPPTTRTAASSRSRVATGSSARSTRR
jgi:hypothetical protein